VQQRRCDAALLGFVDVQAQRSVTGTASVALVQLVEQVHYGRGGGLGFSVYTIVRKVVVRSALRGHYVSFACLERWEGLTLRELNSVV